MNRHFISKLAQSGDTQFISGAVEGLSDGAHTRGGAGGVAAAYPDGPSFGFGVFCGEDINASGARFTEAKTRSQTEGGVR